MLDKLICAIENYIKYLHQTGLYVTVHGDISEYIHSVTKIDIHSNPFCLMVKTNYCAWVKCMKSQQKIYAKNCSEPFWGMCHAGVEEYVFPLYAFSNMFGFICVSGYGINSDEAKRRIDAVSKEFTIDRNELWRTYQSLKHEKPDIDAISDIINPLAQMLIFLNMLRPSAVTADVSDNQIYNTALQFIERRYMQSITVADIAAHCGCSVSTVSHTFSRYAGQTVKQYVTFLRIEHAKKLLESTLLPVKTIAALCGFGEPDYFSAVFKRHTGSSPTEYKRSKL